MSNQLRSRTCGKNHTAITSHMHLFQTCASDGSGFLHFSLHNRYHLGLRTSGFAPDNGTTTGPRPRDKFFEKSTAVLDGWKALFKDLQHLCQWKICTDDEMDSDCSYNVCVPWERSIKQHKIPPLAKRCRRARWATKGNSTDFLPWCYERKVNPMVLWWAQHKNKVLFQK